LPPSGLLGGYWRVVKEMSISPAVVPPRHRAWLSLHRLKVVQSAGPIGRYLIVTRWPTTLASLGGLACALRRHGGGGRSPAQATRLTSTGRADRRGGSGPTARYDASPGIVLMGKRPL
jgi:hypothetical protein